MDKNILAHYIPQNYFDKYNLLYNCDLLPQFQVKLNFYFVSLSWRPLSFNVKLFSNETEMLMSTSVDVG